MQAPSWCRPSMLPRLAVCPASGVTSEGSPRIGGDAAAIGSAFHEIAATWLTRGIEAAADEVKSIAHRHQVDAETLFAWLNTCHETGFPGKNVRVSCEVNVELDLGFTSLKGRADVLLEHDGGLVEIVDFKSGNPDFYDPGALWQVEAYAIAAAQLAMVHKARASLWYVQRGEDGWVSIDVDIAEASSRIAGVVEKALRQVDLAPEAREYRVGEGCTFCPGAGVCPALSREVRPFLAVQGYEPQAITLENFGTFAAAVDRASKIVDAAKDARKLFVRENGGRIEADGYAWELRTQTIAEHTRKASTFEKLQRSKSK